MVKHFLEPQHDRIISKSIESEVCYKGTTMYDNFMLKICVYLDLCTHFKLLQHGFKCIIKLIRIHSWFLSVMKINRDHHYSPNHDQGPELQCLLKVKEDLS